MNSGYGFFDYKYNIDGFTPNFFGTEHIAFIILAFSSVLFIGIFMRGAIRENVDRYLKFISLFTVVWEISKVAWESYYDITSGRGFNTLDLLPIYTCDLFIYTSLIAAWSNGKTREISLSFLSTLSIVCGSIGIIFNNGLKSYPFWTYGALYSLLFHYFMVLTGVILLATGYKTLSWRDIYKAFIPVAILSIFAIPTDYILGSDYMQVYNGSGIPVISTLAETLAGRQLRPLYTVIMLLNYLIMTAMTVSLYKVFSLIKYNNPAVFRDQ